VPEKPRKLLMFNVNMAGGTGVYCRMLATGLARFFPGEFQPSLLLSDSGGVLPLDQQLFSSIEILPQSAHPGRLGFLTALRHLIQARRAVKRLDADIVLGVHTYANLIVSFLPARRRRLLTVHGEMTSILAGARCRRTIRAIIRWRYNKAPVVAPARGVADDLRRNFAVADVTVIPHGIDAQRILDLADQPAADLPADHPYLLAAGRLVSQKDYPTLLRAFAIAAGQGLREDLVILGDGDDRPVLENLAGELSTSPRVYFLGHRDNPFPYMKRARAFVLSSVWEGFGLVLLEAMTLGIPCIATDCPAGPAEILDGGRCGILVPMRDPKALAAAMLKLCSDADLYRSLSEQSLIRAGQLSLKQMVTAYHDIFLSASAVA